MARHRQRYHHAVCAAKLEADSTPQAGPQTSNLIHIQMTPLQSLDSYAAKLKTDGMEVAIYSGSCPLTCLAHPLPLRTLQHQVGILLHAFTCC